MEESPGELLGKESQDEVEKEVEGGRKRPSRVFLRSTWRCQEGVRGQ